MDKKKKIMTLALTASLLTAVGLLGMGTGAITNMILNSHIHEQGVGSTVQLNSVITTSNLGNVYWGKTIVPTNRQLNSILKIVNNPNGANDDKWHPNQWKFDSVSVSDAGVGSATVKVVEWSPDYDTTTGNAVDISWTQNNPATPIDLNSAFSGTSNTVNLNSAYGTYLATQNPNNIASLKGTANQKSLLQWLDSGSLYNDNLDINQIQIDTTTSSSGLQWNATGDDIDTYSVNLIPIANSNMYTGSIKVKFNVSRINFSRATTTSMDAYYGGSLPEQPSDAEIFGWFINNNSSVFGTTTNITQNDVDFGSYASENRTLSVKAGNEYWTGNKAITYKVDPSPIDLATAVPTDARTLSFIKKPTFADFMHALDSKLSTSIIWDAITLPCNWSEITTWNSWAQDGTYTLTSVAGNLYYTGSVTITWSTGY